MATKTIAWNSGSGNITVVYGGSGDGTATITSSDNNLYEARSQQITFQTTAGSPQRTVTVTVAQAAKQRIDLSAAIVTAANQTYNGSAKTPVPTVVLDGETIPSTGYDVTYSNNTNAGSATITVTGKGDYTGTATGTFTINQATGQVTTAPTARNVTYTGSNQYLVTAGSGTGTMQYRSKLSTSSTWSSWSTTRARRTDAGTYNVQYRAAASSDGNYTVSAVGELNVTMAKRTPVVNVAPALATGLVYTGSALDLLTGGSMKHSSSSSTAVAGTFTYAQQTNAGTYSNPTWSFVPTDSTNYNNASGTVTGSVTIDKAASSVTTAPTAKTGQTYNGSAKTLVNAGTATGGTMYYYATTTNSKPSSTTSFTTTIPTKTNAGTYYVWYYVKGDSNHNDTAISSTSVSVTIAKADPTYTAPEGIPGYTYNGETKYLMTAGSTSDGTFYYSKNGTSWSTTRPTEANAGTYTAYWKIVGDSNHNDVPSTSVQTTINKAQGTVATAPTAKTGLVYDGTNQVLINAGVGGTGTMQYRFKLSTASNYSSWSESLPSAIVAGTYDIQYRAGASADGNYDVSATGTISSTLRANYLEFKAIDSGTFTFTNHGSGNNIQYSVNGGSTWVSLASGTASPVVSAGNNILWKSTRTPGNANNNYGVGTFSSTGRFDVEGNAMSLLYGDDFIGKVSLSGKSGALGTLFEGCTTIVDASNMKLPATTTVVNCYLRMFKNCTSLVGAPELPATTLTGTQVYYEMFYGCTSLTTAPNLPATTLTSYCYYNMFQNCSTLTTVQETLPATTLQQACYRSMFNSCSSLVVAPKLPATTLQTNCYYAMFRYCSSLTTAPELPAETLVTNCYSYMLGGCTRLAYVKALFLTTPGASYTVNWLASVSATGTFVKNSAATWSVSGSSGIPSGWTVETASS